jgi:hypothetical protein
MDATRELRRLINGYPITQAVHVAAVLGISDLLAGAPQSLAELAAKTDAHPDSLARLLRALVACGLYRIEADGRYANTDLGDALRADAPDSPAGWAAFVGRPYYWQAWSSLLHSVRTGENAFRHVHGAGVWAYRQSHPEEQAAFDRAMTTMSQGVGHAVAEAYDFGRHRTVVDVGGGRGALLSAVLARHPGVRGVLVDQPAVVAAAELPTEIAQRCEAVGGDFFAAVPPGGDVYLLKAVIHDWPDSESVQILSNVRKVLPDDGVLILVEQLLDEGPDSARTAFSDLNMLVAPGGRERTRQEYAALFERAGLVLAEVIPTASDVFLVVAAPA